MYGTVCKPSAIQQSKTPTRLFTQQILEGEKNKINKALD